MKSLFKQMDLTKGNIIKNILLFSIPILLSYLLQQVYTISDAAICGQFLNANEVAGINNTSNLVFMVLQFAIGITSGFSVITSTLFGHHNEEGIRTRKVIVNNSNGTVITEIHDYILEGNKIIKETVSGSRNYVLNFDYDMHGELIGFEYNENYYFYVRDALGNINDSVKFFWVKD